MHKPPMNTALCILSAERVQCWLVRDKRHFFFVVTDKGMNKPTCSFIRMQIRPYQIERLRWKRFRDLRKKEKGIRVIQPCEDKRVSVGPTNLTDVKTQSFAAPEVLRSFLGSNHCAVKKAITRHVKEYFFVFDLLKRSEGEALSYCKKHNIALLHSGLHTHHEEMKKKEEWEEFIQSGGSLRTGKAWIDLNLNV